MTDLKPHLQQQVQPIVTKWEGFVAKVNQRIAAVMEEAQGGIDALIAQHATDPAPMGTALTAVQSRFHGIDSKVDSAWEKIDEEFEGVLDVSDLPHDDWEAVYDVQERQRIAYDGLRSHIELQFAWLEMRNQAAWARKLYEIVQQELAEGLNCSQCGGQIQISVYWQASNETCPHCQSVNSVSPGMATGLFYQGIGLHALSHEQAWNEWMAEQSARSLFDDRRHPTAGDQQRWLAAVREYWTKYYETTKQLNPGFGQEVAEAVENRVKQVCAYEPPLEGIQREFYEKLCSTAAQHDPAALRALLQDMPSGVDLDECAECLVEHADRAGAILVLEYKYEEDDEDDPRGPWIREQLKDIVETLSG